MTEQTKAKKVRIVKFAAEYNLASEMLVDFLIKKGYEVKSHNSLLNDEMVADIITNFRKDIEKAETHYKKISEINKKRETKKEEAVKQEPEIEEEVPVLPTEEVQSEVSSEEVIEKEEIQEEVQLQETVLEQQVTEAVETSQTKEEIKEEIIIEEKLPEPPPPIPEIDKVPGKFRTASEIEIEQNRDKKLTVIGKMDLTKPKRRDEKPKQDTSKETKPIESNDKPKTTTATTDDKKAADLTKRKKLKPKKKLKEDGSPEETVKEKKRKRVKKYEIDEKEVAEAIKRTMLTMDDTSVSDRANFRKKRKKEKAEQQERLLEEKELNKSILHVTEYIAVNELANLMNIPVAEVIAKCISMGLMVSINQRLDYETITLVADEFDFQIELQEEYVADVLADYEDKPESLQSRPAVVTIMGHVDHGKTSLLDYIRSTNVVAGESGGITQHIGAYKVEVSAGKFIAFLDTPGHEAFTAMRARGAKVTDIVVLIVAADDAVMPQTVEAINHAQAAAVPIIIAINKIDKPGSNIEKIKQQLADRNILVEDWGGKYQCVEISAKKGLNIDLLLEKILLESDLLELKANHNRDARGVVIESQMDKGRGVTGTILVQKGTLKIGDPFVSGNQHGRVRAMFDERNNKVSEAGPSTPVLVLGFEGAPQAGDNFVVVQSEREAREVAIKRQQLKREQDQRQIRLITLDEIASQISIGGIKELLLVVKGDVDGSVEALSDSLMKISNKEVKIKVIHKGVGPISEGDVLLAAASRAIIIGFHVRPNLNARKLAEVEKVDIRLYNVIYDAINEVKSALEGMLSPVISEEMTGTVEVRDIFKVPKVGTVAGCYVLNGKISRSSKVRIVRDGIVIYTGEILALKRFKDDVKDVDAGFECGISIHNFNDIKVGDIFETFKFIETKKKLD